jgi:hypothetical protein
MREAAEQRVLKRCQRVLMGLSTWMRTKSGRRERTSTVSEVWMEVVTKFRCQCWVAKSRRSEAVVKVWGVGEMEEGTWVSEADFSALGVPEGRAILSGWKACCSTRYCCIEDLPAQIPVNY